MLWDILASYIFGCLAGSQMMYGLVMSKVTGDGSYVRWGTVKAILFSVIWAVTVMFVVK